MVFDICSRICFRPAIAADMGPFFDNGNRKPINRSDPLGKSGPKKAGTYDIDGKIHFLCPF
jgi:hypothetical protein